MRLLTIYSPSQRESRRGFTLLEVIIALAILGTAMVVLLESHYAALGVHIDQREQVLLDHLTALAIGYAETDVASGNMSGDGDFGKRYEGFSYGFTSDPPSDEYPNLYQVVVTVKTPEDDRKITVYLYAEPLQ